MGHDSFTPRTDPTVGTTIDGKIHIEERVGTGGIGTVYRARELSSDRLVAVKLLHPHLVNSSFFERFRREAEIACDLHHHNVVTTLKYGQASDGRPYLVMEYVEGMTLHQLITSRSPLDGIRALDLMLQIADAVAYAHGQGIVHRDLKPENMLVSRSEQQETIKLADFGMAKLLDQGRDLTKTGTVIGSPYYIAPERWRDDHNGDERSDIYSLGCLFYLMVTGTLPFLAEDLKEIRRAHLYSTPPSPDVFADSLTLVPELSDIILRCIRRDRAERYESTRVLHRALLKLQREAAKRIDDPKWLHGSGPLPPHVRQVAIPPLPAPTPALLQSSAALSFTQRTVSGAHRRPTTRRHRRPPKRRLIAMIAVSGLALLAALFGLVIWISSRVQP